MKIFKLRTKKFNNIGPRSDSFYFVDGKLVMHNKADYSYNSNDAN
jgi:hypothetical protein